MLEDFYVPNNIQPREYSKGDGKDGIWYKIFVANVNVNPNGFNVNVNRFENSNVWNGENRHRVVVPQPTVLPLSSGSFV